MWSSTASVSCSDTSVLPTSSRRRVRSSCERTFDIPRGKYIRCAGPPVTNLTVTGRRYGASPVTAIRTEGLSKRYGDTLALDSLSLEVAEGEVYGFLGPN